VRFAQLLTFVRTRKKKSHRSDAPLSKGKQHRHLENGIVVSGRKAHRLCLPQAVATGRPRPMTVRQMKPVCSNSGFAEAGLDPKKYGNEIFTTDEGLSHILNSTGGF